VDRVVAIRDGMLASETVRQARPQNGDATAAAGGEDSADGDAGNGAVVHDVFEELVVLDRAGRVHVPHEYLEQYAIKGRARLELIEGGILIRAVEPQPDKAVAPPAQAAPEAQDSGQSSKPRGWLGRLGRRGSK
jgi:peptide/nickel transport system ATP-binding protein